MFVKGVLSEPLTVCLVAPSLDTLELRQREETHKGPPSSLVVEKHPLPGHIDPGTNRHSVLAICCGNSPLATRSGLNEPH